MKVKSSGGPYIVFKGIEIHERPELRQKVVQIKTKYLCLKMKNNFRKCFVLKRLIIFMQLKFSFRRNPSPAQCSFFVLHQTNTAPTVERHSNIQMHYVQFSYVQHH